MWTEIRSTLRSLWRAPGFAAVAILTLALGIGANTALFSIVYGVLFRPLDYRDASRLVTVRAERTFSGRPAPVLSNFSYPDLATWETAGQAFESIAMSASASALIASPNGNEVIASASVSPSFFSTLDGRLRLGRGLGPADENAPSVVVSRGLWRRVFGDAASLDGARVTLDGQPYAVVGVADDTFQVPNARTDVWRSVGFARTINPQMVRPRAGGFRLFARLKAAASMPDAQAQADAASRAIDPNLHSAVQPLRELFLPESARSTLLVLWAAVALVLIVSCVNVTNLILTRDTARSRELAVRQALGASRGRLWVRSLGQNVTLALGGAIGGTLVAVTIVRVLRSFPLASIPRLDFVRVDTPVLLFSCLAALVVSCLVSMLTASPPPDAAASLRSSAFASTGGRRARRVRQALVVAEIAVAVILLAGAALIGRSLSSLLSVDIGVANRQVASALVDVSFGGKLSLTDQRLTIDRVVDQVRALPGVVAAGAGAGLPPNLTRARITINEFDDAVGKPVNYMVDAVPATPGYFTALGIRLREGRLFTDSDDSGHPQVMLITRTTARQVFGGQPAIGRTLHLPILTDAGSGNTAATVVGIVDDVRYSGLDAQPNGVVFRPFAQQPWSSMFVIAQTAGDARALAGTLRRTISSVDPAIAVYSIDTLDSLVADAAAQPGFRASVLTGLAVLAVALAGLGLYGVVAFAVTQRTREIGVRMALGADSADIVWLVVREALRLAAFGIAAGLASAFVAARALESLLFGVAPGDPLSFTGTTLALVIVAVAAAVVPARRALRADPLIALRSE
jgi:putative ABC transport system permease protein